MWTRLSHALKSRGNDQDDEPSAPPTDVLSKVYEQHPNLSVFHNTESEDPLPTPSPPSSPSKHARKGMFKRIPKVTRADDGDSVRASTPLKLSITLPKKVRSHLNLSANGSQSSLLRASTDTSRPSVDTAESQNECPRPSLTEQERSSVDSARLPDTPLFDGKYGSVRSILRDPKTPGTGQNVRFFSRDVYKVISPNQSTESEPEAISVIDRLQKAAPASHSGEPNHGRPSSVMEVFSSQEGSNFHKEFIPPSGPLTDASNIFDLSQERDLPTIPVDNDMPALDSAIDFGDDNMLGSRKTLTSTPFKDIQERFPVVKRPTALHDRSQSFSFGQTVFHSVLRSPLLDVHSGIESQQENLAQNRSRALSDTVFQSMVSAAKPPEADINDESSAALVVYDSPEPDPFRVNASTYYTPQTMIPPTPPQGVNHSRKASREEDIIWSLRTQLALQQELGAQYEIDLGARDELVQALSARLENAEKENEKRKSVLRSWKKKAAELEKMCRHLEEEVDKSRQESMDRSVMDEASGEALRQLHRQISNLEREKADTERRELAALEQSEQLEVDLRTRDQEIKTLNEKLGKKDDSERALREGIWEAKEQMDILASDDELRAQTCKAEWDSEEEERRRQVGAFWDAERAHLIAQTVQLQQEKDKLIKELTDIEANLLQSESNFTGLKSELAAQWKITETMKEKINGLLTERETLKAEIETLEDKITSMEEDWNENENERMELEAEFQQTQDRKDKERADLEGELREEREHSEQLTRALQEQEDRISALNSERQFALENVARLEENIKQRDQEISSLSERVLEREAEAEQVREQMTTVKREQSRIIDERTRELQNFVEQEKETRQQMETVVKEKAESDVLMGTLTQRANGLRDELERLRRQIHELQQESADKEVKIVQLTKQRSQDKEDLNGMNIALDSKQQELELVKRRLGLRGTAGSTPAQPSKNGVHRGDPSTFITPSTSRPSSELSDVGKDITRDRRRGSDTPSAVVARPSVFALGKSARVNIVSNSTVSGPGASTGSLTGKLHGIMGPPSKLGRTSTSGTSTPTSTRISSSLARSSSTKPIASGTFHGGSLRRTSSSALEQSRIKSPTTGRRLSVSSLDEQDEKENVDTVKILRRADPTPT